MLATKHYFRLELTDETRGKHKVKVRHPTIAIIKSKSTRQEESFTGMMKTSRCVNL